MAVYSSPHFPAEFEPQDWIWIGFPHDGELWEDDLIPAQEQMAGFANAVAASGQEVRLVVRDAATEKRARALVRADVLIEQHPYGDIWIRDTGPLTIFGPSGKRIAQRFGFNGWGGKYMMEGDQETGRSLATTAELESPKADWILEGGAIDSDGTGLCVTTEQCLLNANRNPYLSKDEIAANLARDLGLSRILWLGDGLLGDHTDGHVDNLARFISAGVIAIPQAASKDDPNAAVYEDAAQRAESFGLNVSRTPSPGLIGNTNDAEPASYMNFAICNHVVVVPTYDAPMDDEAVAAIGALFPNRKVIGLPAHAILTGGGSFHCASQHMPTSPPS